MDGLALRRGIIKSPSLFALPQPLLQSFGLQPWACKLAGMVDQTGRYNFSIEGKNKNKISTCQTGGQLSIHFQVKDLDIVVGGHTNTFLWSGPMQDAHVGGVPAGKYPTEVLQPSGRRVLVVQTCGYGLYLGNLRITFDQVRFYKYQGP